MQFVAHAQAYTTVRFTKTAGLLTFHNLCKCRLVLTGNLYLLGFICMMNSKDWRQFKLNKAFLYESKI